MSWKYTVSGTAWKYLVSGVEWFYQVTSSNTWKYAVGIQETEPSGWILTDGYWDDEGVWVDGAIWNEP